MNAERLKRAFDDFKEENPMCFNGSAHSGYLYSRLWRAFFAGVDVGKSITIEEVKKNLESISQRSKLAKSD